MTTPAAVTKSIGLLADAQLSWFLHRHLDNFILTWQIRIIYRESPIWTTLSWHGNPAHLPGLCKNACQPWHRRQLPIPPGRYAAITFSFPSTRLPQIWFAVVPGEIHRAVTDSYRVTNSLTLDCRKLAITSQACFNLTTNLFHLDNNLICTLHGLLLWLAYGNSRFCFGRIYKTGSWAPSASWPTRLQAFIRYCMPGPLNSRLLQQTRWYRQ